MNIFDGADLLASSERNLFASGLLPTRTPGDVYRAIVLEGRPSFVGTRNGRRLSSISSRRRRCACRTARRSSPCRSTSRQQEIEAQIDELDRRVLLAAVLFIMLGAGIGYCMAERIADPVNRLMKATARIARGDLDARILATSSDEFRRLVESFNRMAADLQRQRAELERTNRLAAWADMARQVAHDIKNPLTPIQLNAEHLRRVHVDRGEPLGRVLDECVSNILTQVQLLRQLSAEFSSFASSPTPRPAPTRLGELVDRSGRAVSHGPRGPRRDRDATCPQSLPPLLVDKTLIGARVDQHHRERAARDARGGTLTIRARGAGPIARSNCRSRDTGIGMDHGGAERVFEPYFSTRAREPAWASRSRSATSS